MVRFLPALQLVIWGIAAPAIAQAATMTGASSPDLRATAGATSATASLNAPACEPIPSPPTVIETSSKYNQAIRSKSVLDPVSAETRRQVLLAAEAPVQRLDQSIRMAKLDGTAATVAGCMVQSLRSWARSGALTEMRTEDAKLTRDRFMASITASLSSLAAQGQDLSGEDDIRRWLGLIAMQTMRFYDLEAGQTSRRNNHRYWAGLAVGRTGMLINNPAMIEWARGSLELGLCQIDAEGFLPLELQRASKAFDYHLYAYVALASLKDAVGAGQSVRCEQGLIRLEDRVQKGLRSDITFQTRTGIRQDMPARESLQEARRLLRERRGEMQARIDF